ncbi:MAG: two-component system, sensor histidine kinase and response regulator [Verrucomicrobiota bacterium]|jgi:DNA-binding response OmpR family regulator
MNPATSTERRILVLEQDEQLASAILNALHETVPAAVIDRTTSLEEAQRVVLGAKPDLFVLDVDAASDLGQEFLYDLRTSHPDARAIILTAVHLATARERAAGLGAIHFLEKPFPHADFVDLVQALLRPDESPEGEKFQGTLSDLHMADIIQLKCMSGATATIEFTGSTGEKGRVFFENGQVRHATAPGREGIDAFNEIVTWKGGHISEVAAESNTHTIALDWQVLLMEAMRKVDEAGAGRRGKKLKSDAKRKVLVLDDSLMLLSFVKDILGEANYQVTTAPTATQGLAAAKADPPDLILLDYILPDMKGDEVARRVRDDLAMSNVPIVYMSAVGVDLQMDRSASPNVIGFLNKPFTSDLLIKTVENHIPKSPDESPPETDEQSTQQASEAAGAEPVPALEAKDNLSAGESGSAKADEWWSSPQPQPSWPEPATTPGHMTEADFVPTDVSSAVNDANLPNESVTGGAYFCGDTRFFSLNWALQTIAKEKLTGALRAFWAKEPVDLLARDGQVVLVTTHDPELYCSEAPITLVNVDAGKIDDARAQQRETGRPIFVTLAESGDILNEPATQLVQHYGQKLFAQLWTAERVRFTFEQKPELPAYAANMTADGDLDHWELATLRLIQSQDVGNKANYDPSSIPAYTRDGFNRVQDLRLTVAEAQFASQFNGARSIAQIAKNLRLDLKFARLTLFRFLALEIVECWPPTTALKPERKGVLQRITRSIGIGE